MSEQRGFPPDLLSKSVAERVKYFHDLIIGHPKAKAVKAELLQRIFEKAHPEIILCIGPSGVGKTILSIKLFETLTDIGIRNKITEVGRIPAAWWEVPDPELAIVRPKDMHIRCLEALRERMIEHKIVFEKKHERLLENPGSKSHVGHELRRTLEKTLKNRCPYAVLVDEGHHLCQNANDRTILGHATHIKSLSNTTEVPWVIFGTYELLDLWAGSGQLARRTHIVHFENYETTKEDLKHVKNILSTYEVNLPFKKKPNLVEHCDYLVMRSTGCNGQLKDLLTNAFQLAAENGDDTLTIEHIEAIPFYEEAIRVMNDEIMKGKARLKRGSYKDFAKHSKQQAQKQQEEKPKDTVSPKKVTRSVGKRNPKRDPVGVENLVEKMKESA